MYAPAARNDLLSQSWYSNVQASTSARVPQAQPGSAFGDGRFHVVECLGHGAFGYVYSVFDQQRGQLVALKTLRLQSADSAHALKREFRALSSLIHPNLVRLHELFVDGQSAFFTMDLIKGVPFNQCDKRRLPELLVQLVSAVQTLHDAGMLHRDIKPGNVLVEPEGRVVVLDFGLIHNEAEGNEEDMGVLVGTPRYMPPETLKGYTATAASDWYSVGVMLYETLVGELPDDGSLARVTSSVPPPPPSVRSAAVVSDFDALCQRLLEPNPELRVTGAEIAQMLGMQTKRSNSVAPFGPKALVGREHQLGQLTRALEQVASRQQPKVVWVSGESGMGKSALLREFVYGQSGQRVTVLWSQCREQEALSHKAFDGLADDLCRTLLRHQDRGNVFDIVSTDDAAHLVRLFPALGRVPALAPFLDEVTHIDPREQRQQAYEALRRVFCRSSANTPLVVVIDDLQWGDEDSARLLYELVSGVDRPRCLFLFAFRTEEIATSACLSMLRVGARCLADVVDVDTVDVSHLTDEDAQALLSSLLQSSGVEPSAKPNFWAQKLTQLCEEAKGSPLLLKELALYTLDYAMPASSEREDDGRENQRRVGGDGPRGDEGDERRIGLEDIVRSRLQGVGDQGRTLFDLLCVAGAPLSETLLRKAVGDVDTTPSIILLESERLVRARTSRGADALEVTHDRIRQAGLTRLSKEQLARVHGMLAEAHGACNTNDAEALARHFAGAGNHENALRWYESAADRAKAALAFDRAAELYGRALRLVNYHPGHERHLRLELAKALANAGKGSRAAVVFLELAATASSAPEALELRRIAAEQWLVTGHLEQGMEVFRAVLAEVGGHLPHSNTTAALGLLFNRARFSLFGVKFEAVPQAYVDPAKLRRIDAFRAAWLLSYVSTLLGANLQSQFLRYALQAGEPSRIAMGFGVEAIQRSVEGKSVQRRTWQERARKLAQTVNTPHALGFQNVVDCNCAYLFGEWKASSEAGLRAETILTRDCGGSTWELNTTRFFWGMSLYYQGRFRELLRRTSSWLADAQDRGDLCAVSLYRYNLARSAHLVAADTDRAHREIDRGLSEWTHPGMGVHAFLAGLARIQVHLFAADLHKAEDAARRLEREFRTSSVRRVQLGRVLMSAHSGYVALARAFESENAAATRAKHIKLVKRHQNKLDAERVAWGAGFSTYLAASVHLIHHSYADAERGLRKAIDAFTRCDMHAHAAAVTYRLGLLVGGEEGKALSTEALKFMRAQGAVEPERLLCALAPGRAI